MDSRPLKYYMARFWLTDASLSNTRGESFPFDMIYAGLHKGHKSTIRTVIERMITIRSLA